MEKKYFVLHMYPLRPDFAQTRTTDEQSIMKRHLAYWSSLMNKGKVLVFGPVLDPKSPYGLGIIEVDNEQPAFISGKKTLFFGLISFAVSAIK